MARGATSSGPPGSTPPSRIRSPGRVLAPSSSTGFRARRSRPTPPNAHSLYVETYTELGLVGFLLLAAFLVTALVALIRQVIRTHAAERVRPAAAAAALAAFLMAAAIDWVWQLPAVVAVVLLLIGAGVAPRHTVVLQAPVDSTGARSARYRWLLRVVTVLASLACIFAAAYPLAASHAITSSEDAAAAGNMAAAITNASNAVAIEPGSAAAQLQLALSPRGGQAVRQGDHGRARRNSGRAAGLDKLVRVVASLH